jgi:hypothetical protein
MSLPGLQPSLSLHFLAVSRLFSSAVISPCSENLNSEPQFTPKQKNPLPSERLETHIPEAPLTLVTAPTFELPTPPVNRGTKPVDFHQTVMSDVSPTAITPVSRQLLSHLYEEKQVVVESSLEAVPRGRLTSMPSVSDFLPRPSPSPSPSRSITVRTSNPVDQPFSTLKTHGYYVRPGRIVVPQDGHVRVTPGSADYLHLYSADTRVAIVESEEELRFEDLPFTLLRGIWLLNPGDYHLPSYEYRVSVPANSIYTLDSYTPSQTSVWD